MTAPRVALALPCLTLLLLACSTPAAPEIVGCPQTAASDALTMSAPALPLTTTGITRAIAASKPGHGDWAAARVPGQVLVVGRVGLSAQALLAQTGAAVQQALPGLLVATTPEGESDEHFAQRLTLAGLHVQPDYLYQSLALPNDPGVPGNAGLQVFYDQISSGNCMTIPSLTQTYLNRISAPQAWEYLGGIGKTPTGAMTAMLDTALDTSRTDLRGRIVNQTSFLSSTYTRSTAHGTATSAIVGAATNNGVGLAGVTWSGPLVGVEVLGEQGASTSAVAKGVDYAVRQGAKVVNMSLGAPGITSDAVLDATLTAASTSAVLVAAAGNTAGSGIYYPASHPDVIAVGAVGTTDSALACYSARPSGTQKRMLDIVAPGGAGYGSCIGVQPSDDIVVLAANGGYTLKAGTSFSAPMVSGVAALMRAANPALSAAQTRSLLLGSVNRAGGLPLLDAEAAVRAATR